MNVDEALEETTCISAGSSISNTARAAVVLAAEVRRLRAAVEVVRALPGLGWGETRLERKDVLRILEGR